MRPGFRSNIADPAWARIIIKHERLLAILMAVMAVSLGGAAASGWMETAQIQSAGLAAMIILWMGARWRMQRVLTANEIAGRTGSPLLSAVPAISAREMRRMPPDRRTPQDYVISGLEGEYALAFRALADKVSAPAPAKAPIVLFTAPNAIDGGAEEALVFGRVLAAQGRRAVAIDCDFRLRQLTRLAGVSAPVRLGDVCTGRTAWRDAIVQDERTRLDLLLTDWPDERDWRHHFESEVFADVIAALREHYEFVVLSAPPALERAAVADIAQWATLCAMVVRLNKTPPARINAAIRAMRRMSVRADIGILLTGAPAISHAQRDAMDMHQYLSLSRQRN